MSDQQWWDSLHNPIHIFQCNELNRGHPTFFVAPFSKYLVTFSLMEMNFSPQVPHLRLVRNERTLILLFWTHLVIGRKTLGGPGWVRYTVTPSGPCFPTSCPQKTFITYVFLCHHIRSFVPDPLWATLIFTFFAMSSATNIFSPCTWPILSTSSLNNYRTQRTTV